MSTTPRETALVLGDIHFPWQDQRALDLCMAVGAKLKPDRIYLNGDITDCWQISKFDKNPAFEPDAKLRREIEQTRDFLRNLRKLFKRSQITFIFGNHEARWARYISANARELWGLEGMTLEEQFHLRELEITARNSGNRENCVAWGRLLIGHFDKVNKHSAYTAKNLLEDKSISLIQNHTHRGGCSYKRAYDRDLGAWENFCLCDRDPHYVDHPNWQIGFSVIYKDPASDFFFVQPHPIIATEERGKSVYKVFYNGEAMVN